MTFELLRILDILQQNAVSALPYKGPLLALIAYGDSTLRSFDDLDILVTDADYFKTKTILQQHGYITPPYVALSDEDEDRFR